MGKKGLVVASCILIVVGIMVYIGHADQLGLTPIELPPEFGGLERILMDPSISPAIYAMGISFSLIFCFLLKEPKELKSETKLRNKTNFVGRYQEPRKTQFSSMRTYIKEGVIKYSRHGPIPDSELLRRAESLSKEEAFIELRDSFWETRRKGLRKHRPDILKEIRYWEDHYDEYFVYMAIKWVFDIPYGERDFWVRIPKSEGRK